MFKELQYKKSVFVVHIVYHNSVVKCLLIEVFFFPASDTQLV